ncbi:MAG: DNA polymerase IV [Ilumatobacteraceae bacterium]
MRSPSDRAILHVDMDMFFVAVELLLRPELRGRPVVVGGDSERGVVAAASYEARRFGVHSAMSSRRAKQLCPQAVFLSGNMSLYADYSSRVFEIFEDFTPLVEGLSLDEAFLDVTGARVVHGEPEEIGRMIRRRVFDDVGLRCSVGVATSKFVAKLASERAKPRATSSGVKEGVGVFVVEHGTEVEFVRALPVGALWGVGPVTLEKLTRLGIYSVDDLARVPLAALASVVGESHAHHLHDLAHARDDRAVVPDGAAKSVGNEETFLVDVVDRVELRSHLVRLTDSVLTRCRRDGLTPRTLTLKIKYPDFTLITRSKTLDHPVTTVPAAVKVLDDLLAKVDLEPGVRLLGVSGRNFDLEHVQMSLFDAATVEADTASTLEEAWAPATRAIDEIRERFGVRAIRPASTLGDEPAPGGAAWGPNQTDRTD